MKRIAASLVLIAATAFICGCSNLEVANKTSGLSVTAAGYTPAMSQMTYTNYGFYFLNCVPFFSGAVSNSGSFALFTDTVTTQNAVNELCRSAGNLGGTKVINLATTSDSRFNWYTILFWTRTVSASATVIE